MFSTILGILKSIQWLSSSEKTRHGDPRKKIADVASWDICAPAEGRVLGKTAVGLWWWWFVHKGEKEEGITFTSKNSCLIEWGGGSLFALILSLRKTTWKEERKQGLKWGFIESIIRRVYPRQQTCLCSEGAGRFAQWKPVPFTSAQKTMLPALGHVLFPRWRGETVYSSDFLDPWWVQILDLLLDFFKWLCLPLVNIACRHHPVKWRGSYQKLLGSFLYICFF